MQSLWANIQRYFRHIAIIPTVVGIIAGVLSGHTIWLEIGAVWFLSIIALVTGTEMFLAVRRKLPPRRRRGALVEFLRIGGYSLAAASMAVFFANFFWSAYRPRWLMGLVFVGIVMCFSSGLVYKARPRKSRPKHN